MKKGISLIVLVITIIVMIILAAAVVVSLNNTGIIGKANVAVNKTNLKQVQDLASLAWADAFMDGARTKDELEIAVVKALRDSKVDLSKYTITVTEKGVNVEAGDGTQVLPDTPDDEEDEKDEGTGDSGTTEPEVTPAIEKVTLSKTIITEDLKLDNMRDVSLTVTTENVSNGLTWSSSNENVAIVSGNSTGATVTLLATGTSVITVTTGKTSATCNVTVTDWKDNVSMITADGVPIPKGFVVSPYANEGEKNTGLVIYALTESEIKAGATALPSGETYKTSLTSRNQFVWVPVPTATFTTTFKRNMFGDDGGPITNDSKNGYYELFLDANNMPLGAASNTWWSEEGLEEAQKMYASVKKYGGFYIGRYEVGASGVDSNNLPTGTLSITMDKYPKNYVARNETETGAITLARSFYPVNNVYYGAASTITYAVQWDRTILWWKEREPSLSYTASNEYGNTRDMTFTSSDINVNATPKYARCDFSTTTLSSWSSLTTKTGLDNWLITTGALEKTKKLNIYDMSGSLREWTMERSKFSGYVSRGGSFDEYISIMFLTRRLNHTSTEGTFNIGFRAALYIK